jgi:hypothetical protein
MMPRAPTRRKCIRKHSWNEKFKISHATSINRLLYVRFNNEPTFAFCLSWDFIKMSTASSSSRVESIICDESHSDESELMEKLSIHRGALEVIWMGHVMRCQSRYKRSDKSSKEISSRAWMIWKSWNLGRSVVKSSIKNPRSALSGSEMGGKCDFLVNQVENGETSFSRCPCHCHPS